MKKQRAIILEAVAAGHFKGFVPRELHFGTAAELNKRKPAALPDETSAKGKGKGKGKGKPSAKAKGKKAA